MTLDEKDVRALLEEAARIDDDGFTDKVMRALPPPVPRRAARWPHLLVAAFALLGCGGAYATTLGGRSFARGVDALFAGHIGVLAVTAVVLAAMAAALGAGMVSQE